MRYLLIVLLVNLLNPIFGAFFSKRSNYKLNSEKIETLKNRQFPRYFEWIYYIHVLIFITLATISIQHLFLPYYDRFLKFFTVSGDTSRGLLGLYGIFTFSFLPTLLFVILIILIIFTAPFLMAPKNYQDFMLLIMVRSGWKLNVKGQIIYTISFCLSLFLIFTILALIYKFLVVD